MLGAGLVASTRTATGKFSERFRRPASTELVNSILNLKTKLLKVVSLSQNQTNDPKTPPANIDTTGSE